MQLENQNYTKMENSTITVSIFIYKIHYIVQVLRYIFYIIYS